MRNSVLPCNMNSLTQKQADGKPIELLFISSFFFLIKENNELKSIMIVLNSNKPQQESASYQVSLEFLF